MAGQLYARYVPPGAVPSTTKSREGNAATHSAPAPPSTKIGSADGEKGSKLAKVDTITAVLNRDGESAHSEKERFRPKKKRAREVDQEPDVKRKRAKHPTPNSDEAYDTPRSDKYKSVFSKFERSSRITEAVRGARKAETLHAAPAILEEQSAELLDLGPIPQPVQPPESESKPTFSALPSWLAEPIKVSSSNRASFSSLHLDEQTVRHLGKLGYDEAFAVQTGLIPLLAPGKEKHLGDMCVSAATGSGKTLAYMVPMIESLKGCVVSKLRGLVIVPTRELVTQAQKVAEDCAARTGLKIGTAVGNQILKDEQENLIRRRRRYDPKAAKDLNDKALQVLRSGSVEDTELLDDCRNMLPGHVPVYESNVDILICTPGRLVDHIHSTRGFNLYDLEWLVIDEADRLLDQSFQDWAEVLMSRIDAEKPQELLSAYESVLASLDRPKARRHLTKVILSATMTKDLAKLSVLRLSRPRLLVVGDEKSRKAGTQQPPTDTETFDLPATLIEYALSVGDGSKKPLYLLHLLRNNIFIEAPADEQVEITQEQPQAEPSNHTSDSSSEGTSSSDPSSDFSESDSDAHVKTVSPTRQVVPKEATNRPRVMIFTNNNENASRLAHVLGAIDAQFGSMIGVLTKSSTTTAGKKILREFSSGKRSILIASDRASRGLDVPDVTHIINYDIPRSVVSYVHRIGRTARAGRSGEACTLFTRTEARWYWHEIARGAQIRRGAKTKVVRISIKLKEHISDETREKYTAALDGLRDAVEGRKDAAAS